jgi:hypothetical protein
MNSDTERLNWLISNSGNGIMQYDQEGKPTVWYRTKPRDDINGMYHIGPYTNFRTLIDAAIADQS